MITIKRLLLTALFSLITAPAFAAGGGFWNGTCTGGGGASCTNGTFAWDADSGTGGLGHKCWSSTSAAGGTCNTIPGQSDSVTFDANSGTGTVVVSIGAAGSQYNLGTITCGAYTGGLDFSGTSNNIFLNGGAGFNCSGTGTRSINFGTGSFIIAAAAAQWSINVSTNLTVLPAGKITATVRMTGVGSGFVGGAVSGTFTGYSNVQFSCVACSWTTSSSLDTVNIDPGAGIAIHTATTQTVGTLNANGNSSSQITLYSDNPPPVTISVASNQTLNWVTLQGITFTGGGNVTANNSFNTGLVTISGGGVLTVTPPTAFSTTGNSNVPGGVL